MGGPFAKSPIDFVEQGLDRQKLQCILGVGPQKH